MRSAFIATALVSLVVSSSFAQAVKFVQPTKSNVGIYENETRKAYEEAKVTVGTEDRLQVLETKRNHYKVKTPNNQVGWVEKRLVASASGKKFMFSDAEVIGYLDNPTPVYIIDADDRESTPIQLDRSFADALRQNVDKPTVERRAE